MAIALHRSRSLRLGAGACIAAMLLLAGCGFSRPEPDLGVTRLSPPQSLVCVEAVLAGHALHMAPRPHTGGWRIDLRVLSGTPVGFLDKGALVHDGRTLAYLPDGATAGLEDDLVDAAVESALDSCR